MNGLQVISATSLTIFCVQNSNDFLQKKRDFLIDYWFAGDPGHLPHPSPTWPLSPLLHGRIYMDLFISFFVLFLFWNPLLSMVGFTLIFSFLWKVSCSILVLKSPFLHGRIHIDFYRTQVSLGSDLWVLMSVRHSLSTRLFCRLNWCDSGW